MKNYIYTLITIGILSSTLYSMEKEEPMVLEKVTNRRTEPVFVHKIGESKKNIIASLKVEPGQTLEPNWHLTRNDFIITRLKSGRSGIPENRIPFQAGQLFHLVISGEEPVATPGKKLAIIEKVQNQSPYTAVLLVETEVKSRIKREEEQELNLVIDAGKIVGVTTKKGSAQAKAEPGKQIFVVIDKEGKPTIKQIQ